MIAACAVRGTFPPGPGLAGRFALQVPDNATQVALSLCRFFMLSYREHAGSMCRERDLNPHALNGHQALNLACLPIPAPRPLSVHPYVPSLSRDRHMGVRRQ